VIRFPKKDDGPAKGSMTTALKKKKILKAGGGGDAETRG
jgi:hypothetical protein